VKQLFVMDPFDRIVVDGDSSYAMMREAHRRGWPVFSCTPDTLLAVDGEAFADVLQVTLHDQAPHFRVVERRRASLGEMDVVWMRKDPPFNMAYVFSTYLLDLVPPSTVVLNDPSTIRNANEKMVALRWPRFCPPSLISHSIDELVGWIANVASKVVIKPWNGSGGRGVMVTRDGDPNLRAMLEVLTNDGRQYIVAQQYIPEIVAGDKRVILIEGEPVGWMTRVPQPGDHRGNMHVGARVEACELNERDREICRAIGPWLRANGLVFVGIDIIGRYMTEINVTSPTGIREIDPLMGTDLARDLNDAAMQRWKRGAER
jgi:glutathione synthase